jgi:hypothetical protein
MQRPSDPGSIKARPARHCENLIAPDRHLSGAEMRTTPIAASRRCRLDQRYVDVFPTHAPSRSWQPIIAAQPDLQRSTSTGAPPSPADTKIILTHDIAACSKGHVFEACKRTRTLTIET